MPPARYSSVASYRCNVPLPLVPEEAVTPQYWLYEFLVESLSLCKPSSFKNNLCFNSVLSSRRYRRSLVQFCCTRPPYTKFLPTCKCFALSYGHMAGRQLQFASQMYLKFNLEMRNTLCCVSYTVVHAFT